MQAGTLRLASANALGVTSAATTITGDVGGTGSLALTGGITFSPPSRSHCKLGKIWPRPFRIW